MTWLVMVFWHSRYRTGSPISVLVVSDSNKHSTVSRSDHKDIEVEVADSLFFI